LTTSSAGYASFFTGLHEAAHHVSHGDGPTADIETIWERLRRQGHATGLFTENTQFQKLDSLHAGSKPLS